VARRNQKARYISEVIEQHAKRLALVPWRRIDSGVSVSDSGLIRQAV